MKKNKFMIRILTISLFIICLILYYNYTQHTNLLKRYAKAIEYYETWPEEEKIPDVGYIADADEAIEMAEKVIESVASKETSVLMRPYYVEFDKRNKVYFVYNNPEGYIVGHVRIIFNKEDGKILAIWFIV